MANAKQVLDVQVSKGITTAQSNEHLRNRSEKAAEYAMKKGNYDPTREHLNFEIVNGKVRPVDKSRSIPDRMADSLRQRGIKDPNEGLVEPKYRTVVNIILGGSRELMRQLAFGKQDVDFEQGADNSRIVRKPEIEQWAKDAYRFICDKYGEQNIAAFVTESPYTLYATANKGRQVCIQGDICRKGQIRVQRENEAAAQRLCRGEQEVGTCQR